MTPDDPRHGTPAGAQQHSVDGEKACDPCRLARNAYQRAWRAGTIERVKRRGPEVIEEAAHLADMGFTLTGVLAELDMKRDAFYKACCRHDARDLYKRLALREPRAYRYARWAS